MKLNGQELKVGMVLRFCIGGLYHRIIWIGKHRVHFARGKRTIQESKINEFPGLNMSKRALESRNAKIVYDGLGVFDKHCNEYSWSGGVVAGEKCEEIAYLIKSLNGDGDDLLLVKSDINTGGWIGREPTDYDAKSSCFFNSVFLKK